MQDQENTQISNAPIEEPAQTKEIGKRARKKEWSFPTVSKCPRCGTTDTRCERTDSKMGWQYRLCQRAICRHRYRVQGVKV